MCRFLALATNKLGLSLRRERREEKTQVWREEPCPPETTRSNAQSAMDMHQGSQGTGVEKRG